jgi:hypothetical protein
MLRSQDLRTVARILITALATTCLVACGSDDVPSNGSNPADGGDASVDTSLPETGPETFLPDTFNPDQSTTCTDGDPCEDGGVCAGGVCCPNNLACGSVCCNQTDVCSFGACVTPGSVCKESKDCFDGEYCEYALGPQPDAGVPEAGCIAGAVEREGRCMPKPPRCSDVDAGVLCLEACEFRTSDFTLEQRYAWGGEVTAPFSTDVMMTPIVIQLDDDDCDGVISVNDIPEIVFTTYSNGEFSAEGRVRAISVVNAQVVEKWEAPGANPAAQLAGGNIDGQPGNEVVFCTIDGKVRALRGDGTTMWTSEPIKCFSPAIADLDSDGVPDVIVEGGILSGATGALRSSFDPPMEGTFVVTDIDADGWLDIVGNSQAWDRHGKMFATTGWTGHSYASTQLLSAPAVADLDLDGKPEVVAVYYMQRFVSIWQVDASTAGGAKIVRLDMSVNGPYGTSTCPAGSAGTTQGGGPVTIADFNGDGFPDIALAGGVSYTVFDGKKVMDPSLLNKDTVLWSKITNDCSSAGTGSSLFDFNGDGKAEVMYGDEFHLRMFEGATGKVLFETCNTNGTLSEYPVIADVDNDGQADIVVAANASVEKLVCNGAKQSGIRIFTSKSNGFVRTRRIWNQHSYHVTNVEEDGTIPANELANWSQPSLNNFRLNKQPGNEAAAPDAVVTVLPGCVYQGLTAEVRNMGEASLPAGVKVTFFIGDPKNNFVLESTTTTQVLYPLQAERVSVVLEDPSPEIATGKKLVYATVDTTGLTQECRPENNGSEGVKCSCVEPK